MPGGLFSKAKQQAPMPSPTLGSMWGRTQRKQQKPYNNQKRNRAELKHIYIHIDNQLVLVQAQNVFLLFFLNTAIFC